MRLAEGGITELQKSVDTLIIIPNQNLFRVANEKTTFADAFAMADQVLYSGVACITDLMVKEGLINLDFADVRSIMSEMGKAMMGTGEATGERRAVLAAEAAIANPLLDEVSMKGARGLLISITGGNDLTLYEVDEAASRIRQEVDEDANIILGATFDSALDGVVRVSVVATGIDQAAIDKIEPVEPLQGRGAGAFARHCAPAAALDSAPKRHAEHAADLSRSGPPRRRPAAYVEPAHAAHEEEELIEEEFIPPAPEQPPLRAPRMPQIDDLPPIAQSQLRAHRGEGPAAQPAVETRRRSLLEKLAAFGISRHEEAAPPRHAPIAPPAAPRRVRPPPPCTPNTGARRPARPRRGRPRDSSTRTAAPPAARLRSKTISSRSRHSCAGNPTERIGELVFFTAAGSAAAVYRYGAEPLPAASSSRLPLCDDKGNDGCRDM